jgi:hypothetical protein
MIPGHEGVVGTSGPASGITQFRKQISHQLPETRPRAQRRTREELPETRSLCLVTHRLATILSTDVKPTNVHRSAPTGPPGCYSSLSRAIRVANAAGYAVAVLYDWINYNSRGDTVTISVPRDCSRSTSGKADYEFKRLDHMGWGDRVSSVNTKLGNGTHCDVFFHTDIDLVRDCAGKRWIDRYGNLGHYGCYKRASSFRLS